MGRPVVDDQADLVAHRVDQGRGRGRGRPLPVAVGAVETSGPRQDLQGAEDGPMGRAAQADGARRTDTTTHGLGQPADESLRRPRQRRG